MSWRRVLSSLGWLAITAMIVVPVGAVPLASLVDRSPEGTLRLTAFPLALAISDVSVREAVRNSVGLASAVSLLALIVGVGLARWLTVRRFRGRAAFATLARISGSVPPIFGAIGLAGMGGAWLEGSGRGKWLALAWVHLAWAVPRVMMAAMTSLDRVAPSWEDAARMGGASKRRAWWATAWPMARPRVARALGGVFAVVLVEPGAPWILNVRRTLGHRMLEAWLAGDQPTRAAAVGSIALVLAIVARVLIVWRGGPNWKLPPASPSWRRPAASWPRLVISSTIAIAVVLVLLAPMLGLFALALDVDRSGRGSFAGLAAAIGNRQALALLADSAILGLAATAVSVVMAYLLSRREPGITWRSPSRWPARIAPVVFGLGAALLPGLLDGLAASLGGRAPRLAALVQGAANAIDPFFSPWIVLILVVAILRIPDLAEALVESSRSADRGELDVARTLGASPGVAWWTIRVPRLWQIWSGPLTRSFAASALDAGPAILLTPTIAARPVGPGLLMLASEGGALAPLASIAVLAMIAPLVAWIVGGAGRAPVGTEG